MSTSTEDTPETPETPDSPDGATSKPRRRSPLVIASVAAAVLLAGGGGAYWASTAGGDDDSGGREASRGDSPKPLPLDGFAPGERPPNGGEQAKPGIAVGEPNPYGVVYRARGELPRGPETAPVYLPSGKVTKEEVARLAKALDVPGTPRSDHGVWRVGGTPDASGPELEVSQKGAGAWSYSRYGSPGDSSCLGETSCPSFRGGDKKTDSGDAGGEDEPVSEERARKAAEPVLEALELDDARIDAGEVHGALRVVNADPVLGGLPTHNWRTSLEVAADGQLAAARGLLAPLDKGDDYPLVDASEALEQLNKARWGGHVPGEIGDCATAVPADKDGAAGKGDKADKSTPDDDKGGEGGQDGVAPCEPAPGGKPETARVDKATVGLSAQSVAGRPALVPSWLFTVESPGAHGQKRSTVYGYPAVEPAFLTSPRGGTDEARDPRGSEPGAPGHSPSREPGADVSPHVNAYDVDGKKLTLRFWGGVCTRYSASADEASGQVKVEIVGKPTHPGRPCITLAEEAEVTVELDKALGDRKVVDASNGKAVPRD
ncbi:hypothetical protein LRS74_25170 [Streptomyces sp. LX-29]|uniref:hypothetical protein n=1 Tax=Streptomyces sp. LX-29 TaxID=2900152 RepID=UPI00240E32B6|nr:hypothetical protein [Streptomyces sp. LX-29]WFB09962.1 hypothetical protein LRS74_25170 [Streptomyces sp. LX-29]